LIEEGNMQRETVMTSVGALGLVPALLLVGGGVSGLGAPPVVDAPVLVMGGLLVAIMVGLVTGTRWEIRREPDAVGFTCMVRNRVASLAVLVLALGLLGTITVYLFLENFQPRLGG